MDYLERLMGALRAEAEQRLYCTIPNDHVWPSIPAGDFEPDACYLRIWLNDMYLAHKRVLYQTRSPIVHVTCRFNYGSAAQDLRLIVGPGQSEILGAALDRVVNVNYPLLGPIPFMGGDVELLIALMAVETHDYVDQLLDVLGMLSQLSGRGELKAALPVLQPLKRGVEGLFEMQGNKVRLGMHDTFTAGPATPHRLTPGYRVAIDITDRRLTPATLWVREGRLCSGSDLQSANPFEGADYFLFYLENARTRGDDIPSVREAWDATIEKAAQPSTQEVNLAVNAFRSLVLTSPDLIWTDKEARILALDDRVRAVRKLMERRGFLSSNFDTSLASALAEQQEIADQSGTNAKRLTREELLSQSWK